MNDQQQKEMLDNIGLIWHVIKGIERTYINDDDTEGMYFNGLLGLKKGIDTYDEAKGFTKSTYYFKCIKNEIGHYIYMSEMYVRKANKNTLSLNKKIPNTEHEICDLIPSKYNLEKEVIEKVYVESVINKIFELIKVYPKSQQQMFIKYFGIGCKETTMEELGKYYKTSKQNVYRIVNKIMNMLRRKLR